MTDEVRTARLLLRRARPEDAEALHAIFGDARAMRYWSTPAHKDLDETRAWLGRMIAAAPEASDDFIVEHEGRTIGKAGCWRLPEVGYILHPDYWGQGLAFEAMSAVVPRLFARFDIPAIEAEVDPRNAASIGLLERLGFTELRRAERTMQIGDEWVDSVYLALRRPS